MTELNHPGERSDWKMRYVIYPLMDKVGMWTRNHKEAMTKTNTIEDMVKGYYRKPA